MTYQQLLEIIKNATMIKKWPEEYRIYSGNSLAIVYCDKNGQVKSFVVNLDGALYHFNATEQKTVQSAWRCCVPNKSTWPRPDVGCTNKCYRTTIT